MFTPHSGTPGISMSRSQLTPSTLRARSVQPPSAASSNRLLYWLLGLMLLYASAWCLTQLFQRAVAPIAVTYHRFGIAAALCALFLLIRYTFKHMYGLVPLIITQRLCRLRQGSADDGEQHRAPQQQAVAHTADKFAPPPLASGSSELQTKLSRPQERSKQGEQHCSCSSIHAVLKSDTGASGGSLACRLPATVAEPSSSFKVCSTAGLMRIELWFVGAGHVQQQLLQQLDNHLCTNIFARYTLLAAS